MSLAVGRRYNIDKYVYEQTRGSLARKIHQSNLVTLVLLGISGMRPTNQSMFAYAPSLGLGLQYHTCFQTGLRLQHMCIHKKIAHLCERLFYYIFYCCSINLIIMSRAFASSALVISRVSIGASVSSINPFSRTLITDSLLHSCNAWYFPSSIAFWFGISILYVSSILFSITANSCAVTFWFGLNVPSSKPLMMFLLAAHLTELLYQSSGFTSVNPWAVSMVFSVAILMNTSVTIDLVIVVSGSNLSAPVPFKTPRATMFLIASPASVAGMSVNSTGNVGAITVIGFTSWTG